MCGTEPSGGYNTPPLAHARKKKYKKKTDKTQRRNYLGEWDFRSTETTLLTKMFSLCCHQTQAGEDIGAAGTDRETDRNTDK